MFLLHFMLPLPFQKLAGFMALSVELQRHPLPQLTLFITADLNLALGWKIFLVFVQRWLLFYLKLCKLPRK